MTSEHKFCYIFYVYSGALVLALHFLGLLSDPESLPMLIVLGWPVSVPVIIVFFILPAIRACIYTFARTPADGLLKMWFFANLSFWLLFINNFIFIIPALLLPIPLAFALSYAYSCIAILLPVVKKIFRSTATQLSVVGIYLAVVCVGLYFFDFQQDRFTLRKSISAESQYLLDAVDAGDLTNVKRVLQAGADLSARDEHGWDALIHAVYGQHVEIVEYLLRQGADPNTRENKSGVKHFDSAHIHGQIMSGRTAIQYAMRLSSPQILWLLLQSGAQPESELEGLTPIALATGMGELGELKNLLRPGSEAADDDLALVFAAMNDNIEFLSLLLDAGANPNAAIFQAVRRSHVNHVRLLLEFGADVNAIDNYWWTPLGHTRDVETAQLLISSGADVNYVNPGGYPTRNSILTRIAAEGIPEVVNLLIKSGAEIDHQNYHGMTALMTAADVATIEVLISSGADINLVDREGRTALEYARSRGIDAAMAKFSQ